MPDGLNAGQYQPLIDASAAQYGIDPTWLTRLLYQENKFKPTGTSPAGAQGIAQFMPGTAERYGVNVNDPASSINGAAHYLSDNLKMFGGNVGLATAAYNWGEGNVQNWMNKGGSVPKETQQYVSNITGTPITAWAAGSSNPAVRAANTPAGLPAAYAAIRPPPAGQPSGPIDPSIIARGGVSPPIPASSSPATAPVAGPLATGGGSVLPGFPDASTSNQFTQGLERAFGAPGQGGQGGAGQEPMRASPMLAGPGIRNIGGNPAAQQVWGQTLNSIRSPTWTGAAPGQAPYANVGQQGEQQAAPYGTSISSQQMAYGLSPFQLQMLMNPMMLNQMGGGYG